MSVPTKEEMLDMLEAFHCQWQGADTEPEKWDPEGVRFRDAIRALILASDKGPEVVKEAVEKCVNRLHYWSREANKPSEEFIRNRIEDLLREAGVRVKEEK